MATPNDRDAKDPAQAGNGAGRVSAAPRAIDTDAVIYEEEGLFSRDIDGQLVRLEAAKARDYDRDVTLTIDGQEITVKAAVPSTDSQGNILRDRDGDTIPRLTTIYDAANELFVRQPGDVNPIPTLCHQEHMSPAGVCRICVVELYRRMNGKRIPGRSLVPACHHPVKAGMEVQTIESPNDPEAGQRVRRAVTMLTDLLVADHLPEGEVGVSGTTPNELRDLAERLGIGKSRFAPPQQRLPEDHSSSLIDVDPNACILCDRCVRSCDEVKKNYVIGRVGKGYAAQIGFDLDQPMGQSSCVACGECMVYCPTDALKFRQDVGEITPLEPGDTRVSAAWLKQQRLFAGIPHKFLQWNSGSVVRRHVHAGEVLCREGEFGTTAFIILKGTFSGSVRTPIAAPHKSRARGLRRLLGKVSSSLFAEQEAAAKAACFTMTPADLIFGEMTCLNHYPRAATVVGETEGEVLEIRRNVLYMLMRNEVARELLDRVYRERSLTSQLRQVPFLRDVADEERDEIVAYLRDRVDLIRVAPGQVVFRQGDRADHFYLVRLGFVKVLQHFVHEDRVLDYLGPGKHFGEMGLLSELSDLIADRVAPGYQGLRTATCRALDDVELVRIKGDHFRQLMKRFPTLAQQLLDYAVHLLEREAQVQAVTDRPLSNFLDQGLFNAQRLLVLDLESCTRCDECTKACADTHDGVTRLIRDGLRYDKFLVASSCRSCLDPYCLVGCPVDAIHRAGSLEITIDSHCIGCGLCADNCPYGNINMHEFSAQGSGPETERIAQAPRKATTCDLCRDVVGPHEDPSCVYACPHNAAFRMSGHDLFELVERATNFSPSP
ncbi:MAG: 4Fe-4S dicluster domain-containing protein [Planctomycetota bacterium]|nr:MAG: 4Fe-4S dicluster domain-containing protein [Planctomycetota bacterium]REK18119.1 MAG: 4Fe-4S dicluster domain-containing protein [Planctomycetota bacterium]REK44212.1 MAG: 4Fe-4S dicluster domain-containing protein [Planctomycetota bacterium]